MEDIGPSVSQRYGTQAGSGGVSSSQSSRSGVNMRVFLQSLLIKPCISLQELRPLICKAAPSQAPNGPNALSDEDVDVFVEGVAKKIKRFGMDFRRCKSEDCPPRRSRSQGQSDTNYTFYSLINTVNDSICGDVYKPPFSPNELEILKRIIASVVEQSDQAGCIPLLFAKNVWRRMEPKFTMKVTKVDELVELWTVQYYLAECGKTGEHGSDYIALGPRALVEFEQYIKHDLKAAGASTTCGICNSLCIRGAFCNSCYAKFHFECEAKMIQMSLTQSGSQRNGGNCIKCAAPYKRRSFDEEAESDRDDKDQEEEDDDEENTNTQNSSKSKSKSKPKRRLSQRSSSRRASKRVTKESRPSDDEDTDSQDMTT